MFPTLREWPRRVAMWDRLWDGRPRFSHFVPETRLVRQTPLRLLALSIALAALRRVPIVVSASDSTARVARLQLYDVWLASSKSYSVFQT